MKEMCSPGYHHNGFVAAHTFGQMIYGYAHNENDEPYIMYPRHIYIYYIYIYYMYIYIYIYIYIYFPYKC